MNMTERGAWFGALVVLMALLLHGQVARAGSLVLEVDEIAAMVNPDSPTDIRLLARFAVPSFLGAGTVEVAVVEFGASVRNSRRLSGVTLDCFALASDWDQESLDWVEGWDSPGGDIDPELHAAWTAEPGDSSLVRFDVTHVVEAWVSGSRDNFGLLILRPPSEESRFECFNVAGGTASLPRLRVWFTPQTGD